MFTADRFSIPWRNPATLPTTTTCKQCGDTKLAHTVCATCGYYDKDKNGISKTWMEYMKNSIISTALSLFSSYTIDKLTDSNVVKGDEVYSDYVTTLSLYDYNLAGGKSSYLSDGKMHYLLGTNEDNEVLYTNDDGSILSCDGTEGFGLKSVITLKVNTPVLSGDGTKDNPYVIDQKGKTNYVDAYVKLGDDLW